LLLLKNQKKHTGVEMKKTIVGLILAAVLLSSSSSFSQDIKDAIKGALGATSAGSSAGQGDTAAGLKEALAVGTGNAVQSLSKPDGYLSDAAVKILLPGKLQTAAEVLKKAGYQKEVDELILSMNRAAESAAPKAKPIFEGAVKNISFEDSRKILNGGNTAATDYFKSKTSSQLTEAFKPAVSDSMNQVGATRAYKALTDRYTSMIPFGKADSFDLDNYVTQKSVDGLFVKIGQEEAKIRTNPAAQTTELLKQVFGK
jgi:hypothetical protein